MVNIVLLTNQERLIRIFSNSAVQGAGKVRVVGGIHEALAAVAAKGLNLIFIQERLGEIAGELLAYRMSAELRGKKVKIILFGDPDAIPVSGKKPFQAVLDIAGSDSELTATIVEIISSSAAGTKKKKSSPKHGTPSQAVEKKPLEPGPPLPADTVDDVVEIQGSSLIRAEASAFLDLPPVPEPPRTAFQAKLENALNEASGASVVPRREIPLVPAEPFDGPLRVTWGKPSFYDRVRDRLLRPRLRMIFGGVFACFVVLLGFFLYYQQQSDGTAVSAKSRAASKEATSAFQNVPGALPSFLPRQAVDSGYAKANPGWERYQGPLTEFRIFREKGLIRAIQIIDRGGQGISPGLLSSVLNEMAGSSQYVVEATEKKGPYLVEKGSLVNGDRIIVYRKEPERSVKAFVLDLK
ncbi:MAG: hypothetical protein WCA04_10750 [Geobacteraceae bacterium]